MNYSITPREIEEGDGRRLFQISVSIPDDDFPMSDQVIGLYVREIKEAAEKGLSSAFRSTRSD